MFLFIFLAPLWFIQLALLVNYFYLWWPLVMRVVLWGKINKIISFDLSRPSSGSTDFTVLIPAHNEENVLGHLLESLRLQAYPRSKLQVFVVSDNSSDGTARLTREMGFECYERSTGGPSTKGQALAWLWQSLTSDGKIKAGTVVTIIDADCAVPPDYFVQFDRAFEAGAEVVQSYRGSGKLGKSFVTNLEAASEELRQQLGGLVRRSLGLSTFLCGSGMAFRGDIFQKMLDFTGSDETITEDMLWQFYLAKQNYKITFWPSARIDVEAIANLQEFNKQRRRWVGDRMRGIFKNGLPLVGSGLRHGNLSQFDQGLYFMQLPRSLLVAFSLIFSLLAFLWPPFSPVAWWVWLAALAGFGFYLMAGFLPLKAPLKIYLSLAILPVIVLKITTISFLTLLGRIPRRWEAVRHGQQSE